MALVLKNKDGFWYWSDGNPLDFTFPAALYGNLDGIFLPAGPTSLPIGDVVCPRSITLTIPGSPSATVTVVEDGGNLDFSITLPGPKADISGLFFDFTNSKLSSLSVSGNSQITQFVTGANKVGNLANGVNMNGRTVSTFDVGMEFGIAGIGTNHQNINLVNFVLSDPGHDLTLDDLRPANETGTVGIRDISGGQKIEAVAPFAPAATPDTVTTPEDISIVVPVSALATDKNTGATLKIMNIGTGFEGPQYGTVAIAGDGKSLTYTPTTLDWIVDGILTGNQDAFQVCVTDNFGGEVTSFVTVNATPVADAPSVNVQVLTPHDGDPITEVRFLVTSQSGDYGTTNQGSDFIKSLQLNLTGGTNASSITDSLGLLSGNTINLNSSNNGFFQDEIDVLMPADTDVNDLFAITATAAEIENSSVTASNSASHSIIINNTQSSTDLTFETSGQSIWDNGAAFSKDFNTGFLGVGPISTSTSIDAYIGSAGASINFRAGFQADLKISAGDISATLPFNVGLDGTYNVTTDTLQIKPTEAQLGGGHFTAHGPSGSFTFGLDFGLSAAAHATLFGTGPSFSTSIGSFTKPVFGINLNSTQASTTISLPAGLSLTLGFPNVNTTGSNGSPGTISGTGTSNDFINLSGDLIAMASDIIFGTDVTDVDLGILQIDLLDIIVGAGLNVVQKFDLSSAGLMPMLTLEDGTPEPTFSFTGPLLTIQNASSHDLNHDGMLGYSIGLVPIATLTNNTSVGATLNASITVLAAHLDSVGSFTAFQHGTNLQLGTFPPLYSNTFNLNGFGSKTVTQTV
jgi:hypothetical protein